MVHLFYQHFFLQGLVLDVELTQLLVDVTLLEGVTFHVCLLHCLVCLSVFTHIVEASGLGGEKLVFRHRQIGTRQPADAVQ